LHWEQWIKTALLVKNSHFEFMKMIEKFKANRVMADEWDLVAIKNKGQIHNGI